MNLAHELVTEYWSRRLQSQEGEAARRLLAAFGLDADATNRAGIGLATGGDKALLIAAGLATELHLVRASGLVVWGHAAASERPTVLPLVLALYRQGGAA